MFRKFISSILRRSEPAPMVAFERDRWEQYMAAGHDLLERKPWRAISWFSVCLTDDMPDEERLQTLYFLATATFDTGDHLGAERLFEETARLAEALGDLQRMVSPLNMWAKSLEMRFERAAAAPVRQRHLDVTARIPGEAWEFDEETGDAIHRVTGVCFPPSFRNYRRRYLSFEVTDGSDGMVFYDVPAPNRSEVLVRICATDRSPKEGLHKLADEVVWWMELGDASYREATFPAGRYTGIRRRWPDLKRDGTLWGIETFFVAAGPVHISLRAAHAAGEFEPDDIRTLVAEFDWPDPR